MNIRHRCVAGAVVLLLAVVVCVGVAPTARGWPRMRVEDADAVARSELIVVGAIKEGSVVLVPHDVPPGGGASSEHHAVLLIREVLKGECREREIPIIIHYGLTPMASGEPSMRDAAAPGVGDGPISIVDTGGAGGAEPSGPDARKDNLWFLRRLSGNGREPGNGDLGIVDPEDFKPIDLKDYTVAFFGPDPEPAIRKQIAAHPEIAERAMRFLDHREIERIAKIDDLALRAQRLIPYFTNRSTNDEAERAIEEIGPAAGPYLLGAYECTDDGGLRQSIIGLWGKIGWASCADRLIDLLIVDDQYWQAQKLEPGWWSRDSESALTRQRQGRYGEVYQAVCALRQLHVARAKDVLELTRRRWVDGKIENKQIVEECDAALKELAAPRIRAATQAAN